MSRTESSWPVRLLRAFWSLLDGTRRALMNLLLLALLAGLAAWAWQRHAPALQDKTTLVLDLSGVVLDQAAGTRGSALAPLRGGANTTLRLRDVRAVLEAAARDEQIGQALLVLDDLEGGGLVMQRELGQALQRFRAGGKKLLAWGSAYDQRQYYLAAHADEVWMHPMGVVLIEGYGRYRSYYKDALDRLGVRANVVRAGAYKNAAETLAASGPSPETLETDRALYGALWASYGAGVERARKLAPGAVAAYVEGLPTTLPAVGGDAAQLALKLKLVDALKTRDEMREAVIERGGVRDDKIKSFRQVAFADYLRRLPKAAGGEGIGVIVAQGEIVDGRTGPGLVGGLSTADLVRQAREDDQVKALVLRVNSPGGSAFGSELVRRELELTRKAGKPVVVSMGDVAASGGYWISMAADEVIADEATVTGSIGVVGMLPSAQAAVEKLGVHTAGTTTTWLAGAMDWRRDPDPRLVGVVQSVIDRIYTQFTGMVAQQRKLTPEQVQAVAQGRAWAGKDAQPRGLVDRLGSYGDALKAAAARAKLPETAPVRYLEVPVGRLQRLLGSFGLAEAEAGLEGPALWARVAAWLGLGPGSLPAVPGTAELAAELGWVADVAARRAPFAAAAHCLCEVP